MNLVWLDLETEGLVPADCNILEIAVSMADLATPFDATPVYHAAMCIDPGRPAWLQKTNAYVYEMHVKNGLFAECVSDRAVDFRAVERALLDIIPWVEDKEERPTLAGSSIHFDHAFLKHWMPTLAQRLSHRHYDVSAVKLFCQSLGMEKPAKAEAHRAREDILESIAHAKRCAEWLVPNRPSGVL